MDDHCKSEQEELKELRTLIQNNLAIDNQAHKRIEETLQRVITANEVAEGVAHEKEKGESSLKKQVFALLLLIIAQTAGGMSWVISKFDRIEDDVATNTAHFREFQGIGIRWGEDIDARAGKIQSDITQVREQLSEHLQQYHRGYPGKENK